MKTKQNPDSENLEEKVLSQMTLLIIYYDFNFFGVYALEKSRQGC